MRTTLTIDEDVAVELERLRRKRDVSFKEIINDVLRKGLRNAQSDPQKRRPFRTAPIKGVAPLLDSMDNAAEVLAYAEGEDFK